MEQATGTVQWKITGSANELHSHTSASPGDEQWRLALRPTPPGTRQVSTELWGTTFVGSGGGGEGSPSTVPLSSHSVDLLVLATSPSLVIHSDGRRVEPGVYRVRGVDYPILERRWRRFAGLYLPLPLPCKSHTYRTTCFEFNLHTRYPRIRLYLGVCGPLCRA